MNKVRAVCKLVVLLLRDAGRITRALVCGDWHRAAEEARHLAVFLHDDLVKGVVAVQQLVPLWRRPRPDVDRILVVKLDRIGDMVNTVPVLDALRARFPKAQIDLIGHPGPLSLFEGDDRVGERMAYRTWLYHPLPILPGGPRTWWLLLRLLWRRYPLVVYLRGSFPFLLLGATSRLAAAKFVEGEPVVTRYLKALESVLGPVPRTRPRLRVDPEAGRFARELLAGGPAGSGCRVVVHAGASSAIKMWPAERYAAVADRLVELTNARVHFLAGPGEKAVLERIAERSAHAHAYHCSLRLPQVVAVIAASDLFIGNDSGLSHVAAAVGKPLVVLWGPANLSMARPEAPADSCTVLYHELACRDGCPEVRCVNPVTFECLMRTQVEDVVEAAQRLVAASPAPVAARAGVS
jgi:heptosyltransferase II